MAASNTNILIKRSLLSGNAHPSLLKQGELAYSYNSNTLFIGTEGSDGYLEIGAWSDLGDLTAGTYGGSTAIPTITVDAHGRITKVSNTTISTAFNISDGANSNTVNSGTTITFTGGDGIHTLVDDNETVTFSVDNVTVIRANTYGNQTIDGTLNITGNLNVGNTITYHDVATLAVQNSIIFLANNNTVADILDIGFAGKYYNTGTEQVEWSGLIRHAGDTDRKYYLFNNYTDDAEDGNFNINPTNFATAPLKVNRLFTGNNAVLSDNNAGSISWGYDSGTVQGCASVAIGYNSGQLQGCCAVALGNQAGKNHQ